MRIALLTDGIYPYVIGGMQKHSFYLAKYFAASKIEVYLYHTAENKEEASRLNCFTEEEKKFIRSVFIPFPKLDNYPGHYIREMYAYSALIYKAISAEEAMDFIYVQGLCGTKLLENKESVNAPVGINLHGLEMFQRAADLKSKAEQYLFRRPVLKMLKAADVVFSLGKNLTELLVKKGISQSRIVQLPIGIDQGWVVPEEDIKNQSPRVFIFVGRYERRKGIIELTAALKQLDDQPFEFHLVGYVPENKKLRSSKIHYWGALSDVETIKKLYRKADVLVCPSYSEGMPTVILEAMASGLAVVASNVGAVSEQVSTKNGMLISPGDTGQLKRALLKCMAISGSELLEMKYNSRRVIIDRFLWELIMKKTIREIQLQSEKREQQKRVEDDAG